MVLPDPAPVPGARCKLCWRRLPNCQRAGYRLIRQRCWELYTNITAMLALGGAKPAGLVLI